jgi:hypothetical protein
MEFIGVLHRRRPYLSITLSEGWRCLFQSTSRATIIPIDFNITE